MSRPQAGFLLILRCSGTTWYHHHERKPSQLFSNIYNIEINFVERENVYPGNKRDVSFN
jgi:hypothetical protein